MINFNITFAENWKQKGYQYILVLPRDKYVVMRPLKTDKNVHKGYTIQIHELKFLHADTGDDYFIVKKKDAQNALERQPVL